MKRSYYLIGLGLALWMLNESCARSAADVVFYHYRTKTQDPSLDQYPLYPQEADISDFPDPIGQNEIDLSVIEDYYANVADAYEEYLKSEIMPQLTNYQVKMHSHSHSLGLNSYRTDGKSLLTRALDDSNTTQSARIKAIRYYGDTYKTLHAKADDLERKINFYRELADTSQELSQGITQ